MEKKATTLSAKQKAVQGQMQNRVNAMPKTLMRLKELIRKKEDTPEGQNKPDNCMWVNSATLAKINYALARLREQEFVEQRNWRLIRLRKNKVHPEGVDKPQWEIWLEDRNEREVEGIEEYFPGGT